MTSDLFSSTVLRLNFGAVIDAVDARSGTVLAQLEEVACTRSLRGNRLFFDQVGTPRLTFALTGQDGRRLLYVDRAEHLKLNFVPPQSALIGADGALLGRIDYGQHPMLHGGGNAQMDENGMTVTPAARILGADHQPLCEVVYVAPSDGSRPSLPDGQDARIVRWITIQGAQMAERRDGVLHLDDRLTEEWRALILGSFIALACEFSLPALDVKAFDGVAEPYPGYADVHVDYSALQREYVAEYQKPIRTRTGITYRAGVLSAKRDHVTKILFPIMGLVAVVSLLIRAFA